MTPSTALATARSRAMFARATSPDAEVKYLPWSDVRKLLKVSEGSTLTAKRDHLMLRVMAEEGPRVGELLMLTKDSFDPSSGHVLIPTEKRHRAKEPRKRKAGRPKKEAPPLRRVPVRPELLTELGQYLLTPGVQFGPKGQLFDVSPQRVHQIVRRCAEAAQVDRPDEDLLVHAHTLRHSFAAFCTLGGVSPFVLQKWLGHRSILSTMVYANLLGVDSDVFYHRLPWDVDRAIQLVRAPA